MPHVFVTTDSVSRRDSKEYWREIASIFYDAYTNNKEDIISGKVASFLIKDIVIFSAQYSSHCGERDSRFIERLDGAQYYVQLLTSGTVSGFTGKKYFFVDTGDIYISDIRMNTKITSTYGTTISVIVDHRLLQGVLGSSNLDGIVLSGSSLKGKILSNIFREIYSALETGHAGEIADIKDALISIIECSFSDQRPLGAYNHIKRRAVEYIHDHLLDEKIYITSLCKALHISRSHLYRCFEDEGGIAVYIRKQRLANAFQIMNEKGNLLIKKQACASSPTDHDQLTMTQPDKFKFVRHGCQADLRGKFIPQREAVGYHQYLGLKSQL